MSDATVLTPSLRARLEAVARRVRLLRIVRGLSLVALILVLTATAVMLVDHFVPLPGLLRLGLLAGWVVLGAATLLVGLLIPLRQRLEPADLAAVIEKRYPELAERLTTTVELANTTDEFHGSPALIALLVSDTARRTSRLDFLPAISAQGALVLGAAALAVVILALSPAVVWTHEVANLGERFFFAWNPATWAAPKRAVPYDLDVGTKDIVTACGRPVTFNVHLLPRWDNVALPTHSTLILIDDNGQETRLPMVADRRDAFTLEHKVARDGHYRIEAGDAVSPTYNIQAIIPVELADDSPSVTITAPRYARETILDEQLLGLVDLSALKHSDIKFDFCFTRPAVAAFAEWTVTEISEAKDGSKPEPKTTILPLVLTDDRRSATLVLPAEVSGTYRIVLEAEHGIRTELDAKTLTVRVDQPPQVIQFSGKEELKAILPYERLPLEIIAGDDIGVARADLEYRVNNEEVQSEAMTLLGANRQEATAKHLFQLAAKVKEGDEISYRIRVQDNLPAEYGGPQTVYYPADRWLKLKVAKQAAPLREQEIIAQRDDIDKRLDALKAELLREQRGVYKVRQESRNNPALSAEQAENLKQLRQDNRANENALHDLAREANTTPALERIAEQAESIADRELRQSEAALQDAADKKKQPPQRDNEFQTADKALTSAVEKLEALKKANDKLAQDRLDQMKVEMLADREKQLAERAAELAAKDAVRDPMVKQELEKVKREQAEVAAELQTLTEQSEPLRQALDQARAEEAKKLSAHAEELAEAQRELAKAMKETNDPSHPAPQGHQENPLGELAKQQAEIAKHAAELAKNVGQDQGEKAPTTQQANKAQQAAQQASKKLQAGATPEAQKAGKETAETLRKLAQDLAQTPRGKGDPKAPDPVQQARQLAQKQEELNRKLDPLANDKDAQRSQQQAQQKELEKQANQLAQDLTKLGQQMNRTPQSANAAQQASNSAQQARYAMKQANEQQNQDKPAAQQSQQKAAQALDRAAQQAAQASQQPGNKPPQEGQTGQAVQQAQKQMGQAQNKLNEGQPQGAQAAMQQAAKSLQQAAQQMASQQQGPPTQPGQPKEMTRPGDFGAASGGHPDPSILGPDAQKYAGKTWGELPGELRTKIVQDMKAKYGDDYARMIKLYFEQLADTNKK